MDEPIEPRRPKPSAPSYLPRLWKTAPETEESEIIPPPRSTKKKSSTAKSDDKTKKAKKKTAQAGIDDGTGASKLAETPVLDTYETRQKVRWIVGGVLSASALLALILVVRGFRTPPVEDRPPETTDAPPVNDGRATLEVEARNILENAKRADKAGQNQVASDLLNKLAKTYQSTGAAREAMKAIDRGRRKLPLFGAEVVEQKSGPKPPSVGNEPTTAPSTISTLPNNLPGPIAAANPAMSNAATPKNPIPAVIPPVAIKPLPSGFREKPGTAIHASGWPMQIIGDHDGSLMLLVPGGSFMMGREDGDPAERPAHRIILSTFYIDQHEITVRQFVQFLKETGRPLDAAKLIPRETAEPPATEDYPVVNVSSQQARAYCNWSSKKLPTEAQWEFAARGSEGRISYWSGELPRKDPVKGPRVIEPILSLPSDLSPFDAFDMGANVWEWTSEFWDSQYYAQFRNPVSDPAGPKQSRAKLAMTTVKGGSSSGILTWREGLRSETRLPYVGFRGALPVEGPPVMPSATPAPSQPGPNQGLPGGVIPF